MAEFFHMGGYAAFVWSAYGLVFIVLLLNYIFMLRGRKKVVQEITRRLRREMK